MIFNPFHFFPLPFSGGGVQRGSPLWWFQGEALGDIFGIVMSDNFHKVG